MSIRRNVFKWHPQTKGWRYTLGLGGIGLAGIICWLTWRSANGLPCFVSLIFAFAAAGLLIEHETLVETESRTLCRESRLFGCVRLWLRRRPLNEFSAVRLRSFRDADGNDNAFVELQRKSGKTLAVNYFYGAECSEAQSIARALARLTGLPLEER